MLIFMEDEPKIFVAWLTRYIKIDKAIKQTDLASRIGKDQSTISSYITGRTAPDFETRKLIVDAVKVDYETIMSVGRKELGISEEQFPQKIEATNALVSINARHHTIIDQFQDSELATEINTDLLEIESIDKEELEEVRDIIRLKLHKLRRKHKTPTSGLTGTEGN